MSTRRWQTLFASVAVLPWLWAAAPSGSVAAPEFVDASSLPLVREVDERFQSFQIGFSHLTGGETWRAYEAIPKDHTPTDLAAVREARAPTDLGSRRLAILTRALAPLYLRYSGTTANSVYFHDSDAAPPAKAPEGFTAVLTRERWKTALDFAAGVDAKVVTSFTNSEGVRDGSHAWTPRMAAPWLRYTREVSGQIYAAELFNEPNAPEPPRILRGLSAPDFARDYAVFSKFMTSASPETKLAGPGVATLGIPGVGALMGTTADQYATASPKPRFDIVSYHFYPALAQRCAPPTSAQGISADKALTEGFLARPDAQFQAMRSLRDRHAPGARIWLTETGGAACGGLIWQPTFLDTFRYLDTQARLAKQGLDAIFTHALISGSNGVIDEKTLQPNADYWAALLWRRLMGTKVLDAGPSSASLHLYAHCLRGAPGGVAILALNLGEEARQVRLRHASGVYRLSAAELQGRTVLLNGRPLALGADDRLPNLTPVRTRAGLVAVPAKSIAFITVPAAANPACR